VFTVKRIDGIQKGRTASLEKVRQRMKDIEKKQAELKSIKAKVRT